MDFAICTIICSYCTCTSVCARNSQDQPLPRKLVLGVHKPQPRESEQTLEHGALLMLESLTDEFGTPDLYNSAVWAPNSNHDLSPV